MEKPERSKEQLTQELEQLEKAYKTLSARYEKNLAQQKKTEETLLSTSVTLHSIGDGVISTDMSANVVTMNPVAETLCGWKFSEAVGRPLHQIFHIVNAETRKPVTNPVDIVLETGKIVGLANHTVLVANNGREYQIADSASPIQNQQGETLGVVLVFYDVTEKYHQEQQLRASEERFQKMLEIIPDLISIHDPEMNILYSNWNGFGNIPEEKRILNTKCYQAYRNQNEVCSDCQAISVMKHKEKFEEEVQLPDGRWVYLRVIPILNKNKQVELFVEWVQDITARKKTEETLRGVVENTESILWEYHIDKDQWTYVSPQTTDILGFQPEEWTNLDFWTGQLHPNDREWASLYCAECTARGEAHEFEYRFLTKQGHYKWLRDYVSVELKEGKPFLLRGMLIDITERKQTEIELIQAKEKAEESDRLKSAFLANMSHEIRTPMNGILGFAEVLQKFDLSADQQKEYLKIIEQSGNRMLTIINDIIDISKIEAGLIEISTEEVNINQQLDDLVRFFHPEVQAKGMQLVLHKNLPDSEVIFISDKEKVYAILSNLVKNAIKYAEKGCIEIGYDLLPAQGQQNSSELRIYVKDEGIGIPRDKQKAIFKRFIRGESNHIMSSDGAGLGLSITTAYVHMLGGHIWVESEEEQGSQFYFTLPYQNQQSNPQQLVHETSFSQQHPRIRDLKILIAEDDEISEMVISLQAESYAREILHAKNGLEALKRLSTHNDIDLVLMDINMPIMDGYEATREIRKTNKDLIIFAQTANAMSGEKEKAMAAGCNDYITKPITEASFQRLMSKWFDS